MPTTEERRAAPAGLHSDLHYLAALSAIFFALLPLFLFHQGSLIIDSFGQNYYIPEQMLKGNVLYRDISVPYGPLSYQFNALLMSIFGTALPAIQYAGAVNSLSILILIYLIATRITTRQLSFVASFLVLAVCVFNTTIANYIFPYASAMTYSTTAFLVSVLAMMEYIRRAGFAYAMSAFVAIGVSVAIKLDYLLLVPVLLIAVTLLRPVTPGRVFILLAGVGLAPLISVALLFFQGVGFEHLSRFLENIQRFSQSDAFRYFYSNYSGMLFKPEHLEVGLRMLGRIAILLAGAVLAGFAVHAVWRKFDIAGGSKVMPMAAFAISTLLLWVFRDQWVTDLIFAWMPLLTALILILFILSMVFQGRIKPVDRMRMLAGLTVEQQLFLFAVLAAITASSRTLFTLNLQFFGAFVFPMLLVVNLAYWFDYFPSLLGRRLSEPRRAVWRSISTTAALALGAVFLMHGVSAALDRVVPVRSAKGTYFASRAEGVAVSGALAYLKEHAQEGDKLLVMPRGLGINFLSGLSANNRYFDFIPPTVEVLGEQAIVDDLNQTPPEFIMMTNEGTPEWGAPALCSDYAAEVCRFIADRYRFEGGVGEGFLIGIYRKAGARAEAVPEGPATRP